MRNCALLLFLAISGGCIHLTQANAEDVGASAHAAEQPAQTGVFAQVPEKARVRGNPLEHDSAAIVAGKKLFGQHCAQCHGAVAEGGKKAPSLHIAEVQNATPGALFWILSNGIVRRGMPDWSKLPEAQRWQITSYIRSLRHAPMSQPAGTHEHAPQKQ